jgi:hypothetical protein
MMKVKQIAYSVAAALAMGYGASATAVVGSPGAVAEAFWTMDDLRVCAGNGAVNAGVCGTAALPVFHASGAVVSGNGLSFTGGPGGLPGLIGTEVAGATARVNAVSVSNNPGATALASTFTVVATVGAGFTPGVPIPAAAPTGQYAGGISQGSGFALSPTGSDVLLHSQVQINSFGSDGSATSEQTLESTFEFGLTDTQVFEISWNGSIKRRAGIGQPGNPVDNFANSDNSLSFTLEGVDLLGNSISCSWSPDGSAGGISCSGGVSSATEFSDPFSYQNGASISGVPFDFNFPVVSGYWEAEFTLPAGFYSFNISGQTGANAEVLAIPEPHSLALLGLGLLGLGFAARRKLRA